MIIDGIINYFVFYVCFIERGILSLPVIPLFGFLYKNKNIFILVK